jgi:GGDEF domain-containing protein
MRLAERLAGALNERIALLAASVCPQVSIGVAWSNCDGLDADALVAQADAAMYRSKQQRGGHPELAASVGERKAHRSPVGAATLLRKHSRA